MQYKDILSEIEYGAWSISDIRSLIYDLECALEKRLEQQECPLKGRMGQCADGNCFHNRKLV